MGMKKVRKILFGDQSRVVVCVQDSIYSTAFENQKGVYLDISGMYASIMINELLPYGKAGWMTQE
jgi:hypothetical protein